MEYAWNINLVFDKIFIPDRIKLMALTVIWFGHIIKKESMGFPGTGEVFLKIRCLVTGELIKVLSPGRGGFSLPIVFLTLASLGALGVLKEIVFWLS